MRGGTTPIPSPMWSSRSTSTDRWLGSWGSTRNGEDQNQGRPAEIVCRDWGEAWITCTKRRRSTSSTLIDDEERIAFESHLPGCAECRREIAELEPGIEAPARSATESPRAGPIRCG